MTPLLAQFLAEAKEFLEDASQGLVSLEQRPGDADVLNRVFRSFHTLKGSSGMFSYGALTRLLHAAEDVLAAVRAREVELTPELVDLLLASTDRVSAFLASIAETESLPPGAEEDAARLSARIRGVLPGAAEIASAPPPTARALADLEGSLRSAAEGAFEVGEQPLFVRYLPSAQSFFCGTDPLNLMRDLPRVIALSILDPEGGHAPLAEVDPFQCSVRFEAITTASAREVEAALDYVADEIEIQTVSRGAESVATPREVFLGILRDQARVLSLPCEEDAWMGRILGVSTTVTSCLAQMRLDAEIPAWKAAVAEATETGRTAGLTTMLERWTAAPALKSIVGGPMDLESSAPIVEHVAARPREGASTVKVALERIDEVMNLVGELVVAKNALPYLARRAEAHYGVSALARELSDQYAVLNRIAGALQGAVMQVRMLPLASVFQRFPRVVRDLSRKLDKDVELTIFGEDTEADKTIIDRINEPLIHLVRNSLDHGIEPSAERAARGKPEKGSVKLTASRDGEALVIELSDDGRGLDPDLLKRKAEERGLLDAARAAALTDEEAMNLIFHAGFSTSTVTSDVSGRGVGMDVVRQTVEELGGSIHLASTKGAGTTVRLSLPLTMAVTRVLMVRVGPDKFGVPMDAVLGVVRRPRAELARVKQRRVLVWRGRLVPLFELSKLLDLEAPKEEPLEQAILLLDVAGHEVGVLVDAFDADVEVVLKPFEGILSGCRGFHGTAILGDGYTLLVLNPKELLSCLPESTATASS